MDNNVRKTLPLSLSLCGCVCMCMFMKYQCMQTLFTACVKTLWCVCLCTRATILAWLSESSCDSSDSDDPVDPVGFDAKVRRAMARIDSAQRQGLMLWWLGPLAAVFKYFICFTGK